MGNKGPLKVLNGSKLILDDHGNNLDSFRISLESFGSFRGLLLPKPVTVQELFFAVSYSKLALLRELTNLTSYMDCPFDYKNMPPIFRYSVSAESGYVAEVVYEGTPVFPAVSQKLVRPKYQN